MATKKYAIVIDVSPSEQISPDPKEVKALAVVFGLYQHDSFEKVGSNAKDENNRLSLKKWSGASKAYKRKFLSHADKLRADGKIIFGVETIDDETIADVGDRIIEAYYGKLLKPSSLNKKGLPRVMMSEMNLSGTNFEKTEILVNDLKVIAWYAQSIARIYKMLADINTGHKVKLDVLIDNLPNERKGYYKSLILKKFTENMTKFNATVVGVPVKGDAEQRDLLVDNLAGLAREMEVYGAKWMTPTEKGLAVSLFQVTSNNRGGLSARTKSNSILHEEE